MSTTTEQRTCARHGQYEANHLFGTHWTSCHSCDAELEMLAQQRDAERARRELAERKQALLNESGVLGRYMGATLDNFITTTKEQRHVLHVCREFAESFDREQGGGLWLIGPPGTGKTHLGAAIVRTVIEQRAKGARIASAREIVRRLRDTWRKGAEESEADVIDDYGTVALLIVDEVGAGLGTDAEQVQLFAIIDARYVLRRPTILLSNLNAPLLRTALGDRSFDRLREGAKMLICNWQSHRASA